MSAFEEQLARVLPLDSAEGRVARRGAVRSALKAGDGARASALAARFLDEAAGDEAMTAGLQKILRSRQLSNPYHLSELSQQPPPPEITVPAMWATGRSERSSLSIPSIPKLAALAGQHMFGEWTPAFLSLEREQLELDRAPRGGFDPLDLAQAGWAIVFAAGTTKEVRQALEPLVAWRRMQATKAGVRRFAEFEYRPGDSSVSFVAEYRTDPDAFDPADGAHYLLLVGSPEQIPFEVQYNLDISYAVGRLDFERVEDYAKYAQAVVARESSAVAHESERQGKWGVFAPSYDEVTKRIHDDLVVPLLRRFDRRPVRGWQRLETLGESASVSRISEALKTADFLLMGCHGWGLDPADPQQRKFMGALLDYDGQAFSAADIDPEVDLGGLVPFLFASSSGDSPQFDESEERVDKKLPAPNAVTARLAQRLLLQGAGAVLAGVGRAWTEPYSDQRKRIQIDAFEDSIRRILRGYPVGFAAEVFNHRYVSLVASLAVLLELEQRSDRRVDRDFADLSCELQDARSFVVLGDPAVRLPVVVEADATKPRAGSGS
ncbi:MAG: hypothetical protein SF066_07955 [Thermoanaerobaculia bacterium]|nr:hypothetical protein [Thermoanaerobaculia bacterium]